MRHVISVGRSVGGPRHSQVGIVRRAAGIDAILSTAVLRQVRGSLIQQCAMVFRESEVIAAEKTRAARRPRLEFCRSAPYARISRRAVMSEITTVDIVAAHATTIWVPV